MEPKLAAILVADIAGYTRLMEAYEFDTHRRLSALREEIIASALKDLRGRVVKHTGDGFIAVFVSVNDAVHCAIRIQQTVHKCEREIPAEQRIRFRMGVNVGDVIEEGGDLYGSGVNVAARLQELAEPGALMISALVREQVGSNLGLPAIDLGQIPLKNIRAPVHVFRVLTSPELSRPRQAESWLHRQPSVAVLPFRTLHDDPRQAYFGEGIVVDIIAALAGLRDFFVISGNSTMIYRRQYADIRRVGAELGARYVLSGSVRRSARSVRVAAELAETDGGLVLWSQTFDSALRDLFQIQDDITGKIVSKVAPRVREAEVQRAFQKRPDSMDAYDHFLQALSLMFRLNEQDFVRAEVLLQRSIALDDSYGASYALAAEWHGLRIGQGWSPHTQADSREALRLAEAAVDRDETNVRALTLLGHYKSYLLRDFDEAIALFDRALIASPGSAWAWGRSAPTYSYIGDGQEAIKRAERALSLSPFDPLAFYYHTSLCVARYTCGDYENAAFWGQMALRENPRYTAAACPTAASLAALGRNDAASNIAAAILCVDPSFRASVHAARYPYRDKARRLQLERHLLAAGLPH
jgi:adenylate cyclase